MIKASEAREQSKRSVSDQTEIELMAAEKAIEEAVSKGEGKCWCYTHLHAQALSQLRMYGYTVTNHSDQRDGTLFEIKWA